MAKADYTANAEAFARVLDNAIRDQLVKKYCQEIKEQLQNHLDGLDDVIRETVESRLKDLTLATVQKGMDTHLLADRLLVAFKFNPEPGEAVTDDDIELLSRRY